MGDTNGLLSRIGSMFGRKNRIEDSLPPEFPTVRPTQLVETRTSIFRPWARRDQALQGLSQGFVTLTQLMSGIKDNLEKQNLRQDELIRFLSSLPGAIEQIPEANRAQSETLKTIYQQLIQQNQAQTTLGEVLGRICDTAGEQKNLIHSISGQLDTLRQTDASISDNLVSVGTAMQTLGQSSQTSTQVLQQVQAGLAQRDRAMSDLLSKQNQKFNLIFWASVVLSITTILSLVMMAYLAMKPS